MNRETGAWLAVALLSISALGVSATTLESSTSTDANDVIDLDYDELPIGQDTASNALDEIEGQQRDGDAASRPNPDAQNPVDAIRKRPDESASDASMGSNPSQGDLERPRQQQRRQDRASTSPEPPSLLDRLLALLTALLPYLLLVAALLAAVGLAVRYRDRLHALLAGSDSDDAAEPAPAESERRFEGPPAHTVEGAWLGMVRRLDVEEPGTMTTSECASAAIEAGLDREAVQRLTETYEEVRYGGRPVTEQRKQTARRSQRRFDVGGGA